MILSTAPLTLAPSGGLWLAGASVLLYGLAALSVAPLKRWSASALVAGWLLHLLLLVLDISGYGQAAAGARLGFGPVLSMAVWLVLAVHTVESRFVPLPAVRLVLAAAGAAAVLLAVLFPGEMRPLSSPLAPLHFALGVGAYGLFGAAVLHAAMLDAAEHRLRAGGPGADRGPRGGPAGAQAMGLPLLQLERLTFRFVEAGFVVLTATLVLGAITTANAAHWQRDHKIVFSLLAWAVFAALLGGRHLRGWRGRHATRWLYAGVVLLLLAYVGSRFVWEVLLARAPA